MLGTLNASRSALNLVVRRMALHHNPAATVSRTGPVVFPGVWGVGQQPIMRGLHTSEYLLGKRLQPSARELRRQAADEAWAEKKAKAKKIELNWEDFFYMRRNRRQWARVAAVPSGLMGLVAGAAFFASVRVGPNEMIFGFDPILVFCGATLGCMLVGFGMGPITSKAYFRFVSPGMERALERKEQEFFKHIEANRSDPIYSSVNNPLPDYYGEKIISLSGYRHWLRKQREHERKGTFKLGQKTKNK
ncbi:TIM23 complex component [Coemansia sp. RSA 1933]|nr:TIM23 complex component [Coemansia sp. RSA 1933]